MSAPPHRAGSDSQNIEEMSACQKEGHEMGSMVR